MSDNVLYSIVIPTFNSSKTIVQTIESCLEQMEDGASGELIVVDDGSTDQTADIVRKYSVKYLFQENQGPAAARNLGWRSAKGEIICFIDADCIPADNWLSKLVNRLKSGPDLLVGVGGREVQSEDQGSLLAHLVSEEFQYRYYKMKKNVHFLCSACAAYKKSALKKAGGFDERFPTASAEDNACSYRLIRKGYLLEFDYNIVVFHRFRDDYLKYFHDQYRHAYWRAVLYKKHPQEFGNDDLYSLLDWVQPILLGLGLVSLLLSKWISLIPFYLLTVGLLMTFFPVALWTYKKQGFLKSLMFQLVKIVRLMAWCAGFSIGFVESFRK